MIGKGGHGRVGVAQREAVRLRRPREMIASTAAPKGDGRLAEPTANAPGAGGHPLRASARKPTKYCRSGSVRVCHCCALQPLSGLGGVIPPPLSRRGGRRRRRRRPGRRGWSRTGRRASARASSSSSASASASSSARKSPYASTAPVAPGSRRLWGEGQRCPTTSSGPVPPRPTPRRPARTRPPRASASPSQTNAAVPIGTARPRDGREVEQDKIEQRADVPYLDDER